MLIFIGIFTICNMCDIQIQISLSFIWTTDFVSQPDIIYVYLPIPKRGQVHMDPFLTLQLIFN